MNPEVATAARARRAHRSGESVVVLSDDRLAVTIAPDRGADVLSMLLAPRHVELLWRSPRSRRSAAASGLVGGDDAQSFYDTYPGGIQELFPNAGPAAIVDGCPLPMHGEACRLRWDVTIERGVDDACTVVCETDTVRYPCTLRKTFGLEPDATLRIETSVTNRSPRALPMMWALHPAYGTALVGPRTRLHLGAREAVSHPTPFGRAQCFAPGTHLDWSTAARDGVGLLAGGGRTADLVYAHVDEGWYVLHNPDTGLALSASWPADIFPWVWLWQECHDDAGWPWYGRHHIVGVEMHTSMPAEGLAVAVDNGTARWLEPGETVSAVFRLGVDEIGEGPVAGPPFRATVGHANDREA